MYMCICVYVYMCICVCIYIFVYAYIYIYIYMCVHVYVNVYMKKSAKNDARTFLMLGGGGGLERYVMRWGALEGLSWYGIHGLMVCHVQLCYMAWHTWNTCRGLVMSWHDMACIEYMSGACHVRAWHGTHGIHVGGLSCHGMPWNTCRGLVMFGHGMARMEYMSGACHVMACHGIHVEGSSCYRAWHSTHGLHVGDCHVMACMEYMSGIAMSPCIYVAMPCPVVQKLGRAAKHFSWVSAPDLFIFAEEAVWAPQSCCTVILLRPRHAIRLNRPNRLLRHFGLMCWFKQFSVNISPH